MTTGNCGFTISEPVRQAKTKSVGAFAVCCISVLTLTMDAYTSQHVEPKLKSEVCSDYNRSFLQKEAMLDRLDKLRNGLNSDWDGHGGLPMEKESYKNTRNAIFSFSSRFLSHWNLFPCPNGTFLLTTKDNTASINIGNRDFSYVAYRSAENHIKGISPYSDESFIKAIDCIHNVLGYEV